MERRDHSRIGRIGRVGGGGGGLTEGAQADMRDWFWVDSPHSSADSSNPAEDKPSEHVGVMEERRLSSLGHHLSAL